MHRGSHSGSNFWLNERNDSIWKNGLSLRTHQVANALQRCVLDLRVEHPAPRREVHRESDDPPLAAARAAALEMRNSVMPFGVSGSWRMRSSVYPKSWP